MKCDYLLVCLYHFLSSSLWFSFFVLMVMVLLISYIPPRWKEKRHRVFWSFCAIGFTSLVIGYMSSLSRETGIPDIVSATISVFGGYMIYKFLGERSSNIDIVGSSLGIIVFIGFLLYGGIIGAYNRETYEKIELPKKIAAQEEGLKTARKELGTSSN